MTKINKDLQYKDNPRKITEEQMERLKNDLLEFGDLSGVTYCRNNKAYVGGNQRSKVFDGSEVTIVERFDTPREDKTVTIGFINWQGSKYLYREVEFTEDQFRKACIVANAAGGDWDKELLKEWNQDQLKEWGLDLPIFSPVDLSGFFGESQEPGKSKEKLCPHCGKDINKTEDYENDGDN